MISNRPPLPPRLLCCPQWLVIDGAGAGKIFTMLPKSRIFSALLLGLGVALIVAGLLAPRFFHVDGRLPMDLEETTFTITDDQAQTRLMSDPDGRVLDSAVNRQMHLEIQNPVEADAATVRVGTTTARLNQQSDLDRLISAEVWNYRIDRTTGEALTPATMTDQLASPTAEIPIDGLWVKFPSSTQQTTYEVFSQTLRETRPAVFAEELEIDGTTVYRFRQEIEPTNVRQLYPGIFNETTFATDDGGEERGFLFHSVERDFFVEPNSGMIVDIHENINDYYGTADGTERETVLQFDGTMAPEQVSDRLAQAADVPHQSTAQTIRWVIVGIGAVLALAGIAGGFGLFGRRDSR